VTALQITLAKSRWGEGPAVMDGADHLARPVDFREVAVGGDEAFLVSTVGQHLAPRGDDQRMAVGETAAGMLANLPGRDRRPLPA